MHCVVVRVRATGPTTTTESAAIQTAAASWTVYLQGAEAVSELWTAIAAFGPFIVALCVGVGRLIWTTAKMSGELEDISSHLVQLNSKADKGAQHAVDCDNDRAVMHEKIKGIQRDVRGIATKLDK